MMRLPKFEYRAARSVEEALAWLAEYAPAVDKDPEARAMLMAGGTDILPNMKHKVFTPKLVIGLRTVAALRGISYDPERGLRLGAGVRLSEIETSPIVQQRYPALAAAAATISTPQLRQMGTVGGNLCLDTRCNYYNQSEFWRGAREFCLKKGSEICRVAPNGTGCYAVSSCDTAPALIAFGATVRLAGRDGARATPVAALYADDGIHPVKLHDGALLTEIALPPLAGDWRSTYVKYRVRGAFDFPIASVAAVARFDGDLCAEARVTLQGVAPAPLPLPEAEALLRGQRWTPELIEAAAEVAYRAAHPMDNTSGTIALRKRIIRSYTRQALATLAAGPATTAATQAS
ncbi:MAG TPA: FAD binding domain-containing protein [Ktedonobacterales bacterium]|nr:FAD binding domain-containing protein [Ktedonobacterales bacterium]